MSKKIKIIIGSFVGIFIIGFLILFFLTTKDKPTAPASQSNQATSNFSIEFLSPAEQASLNISPDLKIQVLERSAGGAVKVYKVISGEADIITDPTTIGTISPRQGLPVSD